MGALDARKTLHMCERSVAEVDMGEKYRKGVLTAIGIVCLLISVIAMGLSIFSLLDMWFDLHGGSTWADVAVGPVFTLAACFVYYGSKKVKRVVSSLSE